MLNTVGVAVGQHQLHQMGGMLEAAPSMVQVAVAVAL